jgi:integrase
VTELTFHDMLHTGASLMIAAGCNVKVIAEWMDHADGGALVLRRYGHLYKGAGRQAAIALESHVFAASSDPGVGSMRDGAPTERGAK